MIGLLIWILIFALIVWFGFWIIAQINPPAPAAMIARVVWGLLCLLYLLQEIGGHYGGVYFKY